MLFVLILLYSVLFLGFFFLIEFDKAVYLTIISIFFPVYIRMFGQDAFTSGTVLVYLLFLKFLIKMYRSGSLLKERFDLSIYFLLLCAGVSTILPLWAGTTREWNFGAAVRQYTGFSSGLLLFLILKNLGNFRSNKEKAYDCEFIDRLLNLFIILGGAHIIISIILLYFPSLGSMFKWFLRRGMSVAEIVPFKTSDGTRLRNFLFTPEMYGEYIAIITPLVFYKLFHRNNVLWLILLLVLFIGVVLSNTRSGMVLAGIGVVACLFFKSGIRFRQVVMVGSVCIAAVFLFFVYGEPYSDNVILRFVTAFDTFRSSGDIFHTINRDFFPIILGRVFRDLSWFGNSLVRVDYHNLLLTTIFQLGFIGCCLFFLVIFYTPFRLFRRFFASEGNGKYLAFVCIVSFVVFLMNETKFEFTRKASYQQICWALFGTFCLVAKGIDVKGEDSGREDL